MKKWMWYDDHLDDILYLDRFFLDFYDVFDFLLFALPFYCGEFRKLLPWFNPEYFLGLSRMF